MRNDWLKDSFDAPVTAWAAAVIPASLNCSCNALVKPMAPSCWHATHHCANPVPFFPLVPVSLQTTSAPWHGCHMAMHAKNIKPASFSEPAQECDQPGCFMPTLPTISSRLRLPFATSNSLLFRSFTSQQFVCCSKSQPCRSSGGLQGSACSYSVLQHQHSPTLRAAVAAIIIWNEDTCA